MRVVIRWTPRSKRHSSLAAEALSPVERLQILMKAAHETPAFAGSHRSFESIVPVSLDEYWAHPRSFQHPQRPARLARAQYPLEPAPRLAIVAGGFVENQNTLCFPHGWCHSLRDFRPEAIAGPVSAMRRLATSVFNRGAHFPHLKRPILVYSGFGFSGVELLTDEDRELLWKAFHVPIYEQFLGLGKEVLATECDAHQGMHWELSRALVQKSIDQELIVTSLVNLASPIPKLATGLHADLSFEPCPCGHTGPRLMALRPAPAHARISLVNLAMAGD